MRLAQFALLLLPVHLFAALPVLEVTDVAFLGGGIADTFKGRIHGRKHALKPVERIGESSTRWGEFGQGNPEGELVCLPLMQRLGLKAPEAFLFRPGQEAPGVLATTWVDEALAGGPVEPAWNFLSSDRVTEADARAFARMFLADVIVGNPDRHGGNYFVWTDEAGVVRPVPIDHNLALFTGNFMGDPAKADTIAPFWMERSSMFAGRLAADPGWGDLLVEEAAASAGRLGPEVVAELVAAVPEEIPAERRDFIRRVLDSRVADLARAVQEWREGWSPKPIAELPKIPGRIGWIIQWSPEGAASGALFAAELVRTDPTLEKPLLRFLQIPADHSLPGGLASWAEARAEELADLLGFDLEPFRKNNGVWARKIAVAFAAARSYLDRARGLAPEKVDALLGNTVLEFAWNGGGDATNLYERVLAAVAGSEEIQLGRWRCLRLTQALAREIYEGDLSERMERFRNLLGEYRGEVRGAAEQARLRAAAKAALLSGFDRILTGLLPEATPSQREQGLFEVLSRFGSAGLELEEGRARPETMARALRGTAAASGSPLGHSRFWSLLRGPEVAGKGAWLAGWEGPVSADDLRLGVAGFQSAGLNADSAARLTFERLSRGAFGGWRGLQGRLEDPGLLSRVLLPDGSAPPPPRLHVGAGRGARFSAPGEAVRSELEGDWLRVLVCVRGLEEHEAVRIPVEEREPGQFFVGDLDRPDVDREAVEALGLAADMRLPRGLHP